MAVSLNDLVSYLDDYLRCDDVQDSPHALNGLQVENQEGTVTRLAAAVDACRATIERAVSLEADFMLVHHGLFWGGLQPLAGQHGRRVRTLITNGVALYSAHLPLDMHPEIGNNAVLARVLGLER
ncbi:MAG: Nif3-like dinuclear metal center hexameric protein, partial [Gemmatimonadales bacterium]